MSVFTFFVSFLSVCWTVTSLLPQSRPLLALAFQFVFRICVHLIKILLNLLQSKQALMFIDIMWTTLTLYASRELNLPCSIKMNFLGGMNIWSGSTLPLFHKRFWSVGARTSLGKSVLRFTRIISRLTGCVSNNICRLIYISNFQGALY